MTSRAQTEGTAGRVIEKWPLFSDAVQKYAALPRPVCTLIGLATRRAYLEVVVVNGMEVMVVAVAVVVVNGMEVVEVVVEVMV